ncbi:MAG: DUF898 family protein [Deltaproteobacteria bacterium]|nr:DUF898 family protein [Deltaproteobacteria bacterium]
MPKGNCEFNGSGRDYLAVSIIHMFLLSMLTLGIYSPWAWVRLFRLRASHTRINGRPMTFTGTGGQLLVLGLVNGLLTVVTLGIYWPWAACAISRWKARSTLVDGHPSIFVGTGGSLLLFSLIHFFVLPILTLGLYSFYAMYRYYAWKQVHFRYGGAKTSFGAGFWGLLQIYLILVVVLVLFPAVGPLVNLPAVAWLSPLLGIIISPWLICMFFRWETRGLVVGDEEEIEHFPPVRTRFLWVILFVLIVLVGMAAAALFIKDRLGIRISETVNLGRLLEMKGEGPLSQGSVRGPVKRPTLKTAPEPAHKPSPPAPKGTLPGSAAPVRPPSSEKGVPEGLLAPAWTSPAGETVPSSGEYEREIQDLNAFIKKDGQNADAYYSRAGLYGRMGELEKAEKDFTRAIEINRRNSDAYYNRGLIRARMGKLDLAVTDFSEAIELNPHAADVYCNRGSAYFQMGKRNLALKDYTRGLELNPEDADLYYNRGLLHLSEGRDAEARADFSKATALRERPSSESPGKEAGPGTPAAN